MNIFLPVKMVWRQLRYEFLTPCCLCIAIAAAVVPLLMILGLKEGYVNTLRQRLASEPSNLEISIPTSTRITPAMLKEVQELPEIGFCMPATRLLSTEVTLQPETPNAKTQSCGLIPTGPGDPFLARYGVPAPNDGEIVLNSRHAATLNVRVGDNIRVISSRTDKNKRICKDYVTCRIVGILPAESGSVSMAYVPLAHVIAVEEYVEGLRSGLKEKNAITVNPVYSGMWLDNAEAKEKISSFNWIEACPFNQQRRATEAEVKADPFLADGMLFYAPGQLKTLDKFKKAYNLRVAGRRLPIYLWNSPMEASLNINGKGTFAISLQCIPELLSFSSTGQATDIVLECGSPELAGFHVIHLENQGSVRAEVLYNIELPRGTWRASASVLGVLKIVQLRGLVWDTQHECLSMPARDFSRLRIYAKDLDSVEPLVARLSEMGYPASGKLAEIHRIRELNNQLEKLFVLIAFICVVGAALSLGISLFNSARKRKRDYAILSTMGFSRKVLMTFPLIESVFLTLAALALSFGLFHGISQAIRSTFEAQIRPGETLCYLLPSHYAWVCACGIGTGLLAALVAAVSVLYTQPSTAIREI